MEFNFLKSKYIKFLILYVLMTINGVIYSQERGLLFGADRSNEISYALKAGYVNSFSIDSRYELYGWKFYQQAYMRYNLSDNAIGFQGAVGVSIFFLGARAGIDYEYHFEENTSELYLFTAGGLDVSGMFSVVVGPKWNLTNNISDNRTLFHIGVDFSLAVLDN